MYILKNAVKNLQRNLGRNILMSIIILTIIIISGISIVIHASASAIIEDYKARFGSQVNLTQDQNNAVTLDAASLLSYGESDLLQSHTYLAKVTYTSAAMKTINQQDMLTDPNNPDRLIPQGQLIASSLKEINDDFRNGTKKLISGKMFEQNNEIIISKALAELNQLSPGDTISLSSTSLSDPSTESFIISGIYDDVSLGNDMASIAMNNPGNEIYGSFQYLISTTLFQSKGTLDAVYYLKNPESLDTFKAELISKGLPNTVEVSTNEAGYRKLIQPVENMANIAKMFTLGTLLAGSLILILLSTFTIRERKYEIGVLRAMGMKKKQAALGLLSEIIIITGICLLIGLSIAGVAGKSMGTSLLQQQTLISKQNEDETHLEETVISLEPNAVLEIVLVSLLLGGLSSITGIVYVTRYEPRKILSERN